MGNHRRDYGTGCVYQPKGSRFWWVKFHVDGRPEYESTKTENKSEAQRYLNRRLQEVAAGAFVGKDVERVTVDALIADLLADYKANGRQSARQTEQRWNLHLKPFFGSMRASRVSTALLNQYIAKRREAEAEAGTVNREMAALKRAFHLAHSSTPQKVKLVPVFPARLKENAPRQGFVDEGKYRALCAQNPPLWLRAMLAAGYHLGFRKAELLGMTVGQVDLMSNTLTLNTSKNGEGRTVKMTQQVHTLIAACIRGKGSEQFVFTRNGAPVREFRGAWAKLTTAAGLPGLLFHDLRRSAVRNMVRAGVPEVVAMRISGHKTRSVFDRYNIVSEADLEQAAQRIGENLVKVPAQPVNDNQQEGKYTQ